MTISWESLSVDPAITEQLYRYGIKTPTQVQAEAIPALLEGRNVSAWSQTGSGKTLAYLIPLLQRIDPGSKEVQAIVLAPTQELAMQIMQVAKSYGELMDIRTQALIGGAAMKRQVEKLKEHPHLVIGTPGRIHELFKNRKLKLHEVKMIIVDEVDQVFGLSSTREVEVILHNTHPGRQVGFFSATYPEIMGRLEQRWMKDTVHVAVQPNQRVAASVENLFILSDQRDKVDTARKLLRMLEPASALLFLNDTDNISNWESKLSYEGFTVESLYGDADKLKRSGTLGRFRDGRCQLLLATDIAARGLDIAELPLVLNLDPPVDADHYVHRAGRTGRMGRAGTVISIITPAELFIMDKFRKQLKLTITQKVMYKGKLQDAGQEVKPSAIQRTGQTSDAVRQRAFKPATEAQVSNARAQAAPTGKPGTLVKPAQPVNKPQSKKSGPSKAEREHARKNKGAPKWLKAKRSEEQPNDPS